MICIYTSTRVTNEAWTLTCGHKHDKIKIEEIKLIKIKAWSTVSISRVNTTYRMRSFGRPLGDLDFIGGVQVIGFRFWWFGVCGGAIGDRRSSFYQGGGVDEFEMAVLSG